MTLLSDTKTRFPTVESALARLEAVRWPGGPICPKCGSAKRSKKREISRDRWQCQDCGNSYSATVGTVFQKSKFPLHHWLYVIAAELDPELDLSSVSLAREIGISQPSAWRAQSAIKTTFQQNAEQKAWLSSLVTVEPA